MTVRLVDLERLHTPIRRDIDAAIARVVDSSRFILGHEVEAFEEELASALGVAHAVGVSSGSDALLACLWADGVRPGDEVATPAFSFVAPAEAIVRLGATPVFADVGDDFNLDPGVAPRTRAVLAVDLFGRRAPFERLTGALYEDAAQAIGAPGVGHGVRAAAISFFPTKNLGALGDGGAVVTDDEALARELRSLRAHGARTKYAHERVGWNMRLDALQAAVLRVKLPHLAEWNASRARIAARYREGLAGVEGLDLPPPSDACVWHQFVVRVDQREAARVALAARGIETEVYYPAPLHRLPPYASAVPLPRAELAARRALALPIHPMLSTAEVDCVIEALRTALVPSTPRGPASTTPRSR